MNLNQEYMAFCSMTNLPAGSRDLAGSHIFREVQLQPSTKRIKGSTDLYSGKRQKWYFDLIECRMETEHLMQFVLLEIRGTEFPTILAKTPRMLKD